MAKNYYNIIYCWNKARLLGCSVGLFNLIDNTVRQTKLVKLREQTVYSCGSGGSTTWIVHGSKRRFNKLMHMLNEQDQRVSDVCIIR